MRRIFSILLSVVACTGLQAQSKCGISILGDSYSTFKGYVLPDSNYVWYPQEKAENNGSAGCPPVVVAAAMQRGKGIVCARTTLSQVPPSVIPDMAG